MNHVCVAQDFTEESLVGREEFGEFIVFCAGEEPRLGNLDTSRSARSRYRIGGMSSHVDHFHLVWISFSIASCLSIPVES